jgi:hypothetical protein
MPPERDKYANAIQQSLYPRIMIIGVPPFAATLDIDLTPLKNMETSPKFYFKK